MEEEEGEPERGSTVTAQTATCRECTGESEFIKIRWGDGRIRTATRHSVPTLQTDIFDEHSHFSLTKHEVDDVLRVWRTSEQTNLLLHVAFSHEALKVYADSRSLVALVVF